MSEPTHPMTQEQAFAIVCQVDLVPKQRGHGFQWRDVAVNERGQGTVLVKTNRAPQQIASWFRKATGNVSEMQWSPGGWWRITFTLMQVEADEYS